MKRARTASSDTAHAAALTFTFGTQSIELSRADVARHPGSLLQSLLTSVSTDSADDSDDQPIYLDVAEIPNSPLSSWPEALRVTAALYRSPYLSLELLSELLKTHSSAELLDCLQQLVDFLALTGSLSSYFPPKDEVPFAHLSVWNLHLEAFYRNAVNTAVQCIMSRPVSASSSGSQTPFGASGKAYFYITEDTDTAAASSSAREIEGPSISVYALTGMQLYHTPSGVPGNDAVGVKLSPEAAAPANQGDTTVPLKALVGSQGVDDGSSMLGLRIAAALTAAANRVTGDGKHGTLQVRCVTALVRGGLTPPKRRPQGSGWPVWCVEWVLVGQSLTSTEC